MRPLRPLRPFLRDRSGIAAVEFALLAPILLIIIAGAAELSSAITSSNRATFVADAIGEMVSRASPGPALTDGDLKNFAIAGALINPDIARYARQTGSSLDTAFKVTISSVAFTKKMPLCVLACEYDADVVFSYAMNAAKRACGQKLVPSAAASNDLTTLPQELYRPGSLVVVDVVITHRPLVFGFAKYLDGDITFNRSSYFRPRERPRVDWTGNCASYPAT